MYDDYIDNIKNECTYSNDSIIDQITGRWLDGEDISGYPIEKIQDTKKRARKNI